MPIHEGSDSIAPKLSLQSDLDALGISLLSVAETWGKVGLAEGSQVAVDFLKPVLSFLLERAMDWLKGRIGDGSLKGMLPKLLDLLKRFLPAK